MIYIERLCVISYAPMQNDHARIPETWLYGGQVKPDGLPELFRLKSVSYIIFCKKMINRS